MANFYDILKNVCVLSHQELPSSFDDTGDPYPELKQYIQDTVEEVCSKFPWTFRERKYVLSTTAGQREYVLPDGVEAANILEDGVRIENYYPALYFVYHNDLDKSLLSDGKPYRYSVYGSKLILDPAPDSAYSVNIKYLTTNYAHGLTEKSNVDLSTDVAIIPSRFVKVVEWGAYALYRQNFKPDDKYSLARNKYLEYLLDMQKQDGYGKDALPAINIAVNEDLNSRLINDFFDPRS